jgi:NAD(P)-dependent dehydrogenase (short-subunit alcohol dehydrogenase family)
MGGKARVVLVTGASSGFGLAIARALTAAGWRVYGASRRAVDGPSPDGAFEALRLDVDDDLSVARAIEALIAREGGLDAVVSNAGMGVAGSLEDTSSEEAIAQFQTNVFGNHRVCRAALPHLRARERSHIVVIGSLAGLFGIPFQGMYSASKFALEGYCEALRIELRRSPVRVSILEPGDFATGFTAARRLAAASGPGSIYHAAFTKALRVIERDETGGGDPALLGEAVRAILDMDDPPLRRAVCGPAQAGMETLKQDMTPEKLEAMLADHFGC